MHILIAGGTGNVGHRLVKHLIEYGNTVTVVSRRPFRPYSLPAKINFVQWDGQTTGAWAQHLERAGAVVNLVGAGIADKRWSDERKRELLSSRVEAGHAISQAINAAAKKPAVLIQASAVGYYGAQTGDEEILETGAAGTDFLADLCVEWESATDAVEQLGVRRGVLRTGVVLDNQGGALPKMAAPFHLFVGGPVGNGQQWFSWIHYRDLANAVRFLMETKSAGGVFNLTAPNPVRNRDFSTALGQALNRPSFFPVPGVALKTVFGEMSSVLLAGQRVVPAQLQKLGYQFEFETVEAALTDLCR